MEPSTTHNQPRNYPPPLDTPHRGTPRGTPPYRPRQSGGTHCRNQIRRVSPTRSTRSAPTKADASTRFFHGSRTSSTPPGTTYSTEDRYRAQRIGIRLVLTCYGICPTCPRRERPSRLSQQLGITSSASRRRLQTSHETLPLDASPLVSRETDSRAWCGRHGRAPTSPPRPALPGQVGTVPLLSLSGTPSRPVSSQEPHPRLSTAHHAELHPRRRAWCTNRSTTGDVGETSNPHRWKANQRLPRGRD